MIRSAVRELGFSELFKRFIMKKICLMNFYSGELPNYFNFFLESCKKNPTVDFIIFNDQLEQDQRVDNVLLKKLSLKEFEELATRKTGLEISVKYGYKLNNFCYIRIQYEYFLLNKDTY